MRAWFRRFLQWFSHPPKAAVVADEIEATQVLDASELPQPPSEDVPVTNTVAGDYSIDQNLLFGPGVVQLPHYVPHRGRGPNVCDFVIIHYTGTHGDYEGSIQWMLNVDSGVSWHLTIGREGQVTQSADFRQELYHAGKSRWTSPSGRVYLGLNAYGIGIEIANAGPLHFDFTRDSWVNRHGHAFAYDEVYKDDQGNCWEKFTAAQSLAVFNIAIALCERYKCVDVLGHNEISPGRKIDPGPAFDATLVSIRDALYSAEWYRHHVPVHRSAWT